MKHPTDNTGKKRPISLVSATTTTGRRLQPPLDSQKMSPYKKYKVAPSGSYYIPPELLLQGPVLPNSLAEWETTFQKPSPRPMSTQEKVSVQIKRKGAPINIFIKL